MGLARVFDVSEDTVAPGDTTAVKANFTAPATPGTYIGYWALIAPDGSPMYYGPNNNWGLAIKIIVAK